MTDALSQGALSRVIRRDDVPEDGLEVAIDASAEDRAILAETLAIRSVDSVRARLTVTRWRKDGLAVRGTVRADIVQTCVVTLDPVPERVEEEIECFFLPGYTQGSGAVDSPSGPLPADLEAAREDPDIDDLVDGRIDLGALVAEHVALGLEPYPRKAGSVFERSESAGEEVAQPGPFAALSTLKTGRSDH